MNVLLLNETEFKRAFYEKMLEMANNNKKTLKKYLLYACNNNFLVNKDGNSKLAYEAYNSYDLWLQVDAVYEEYSYGLIQDIMRDMVADIVYTEEIERDERERKEREIETGRFSEEEERIMDEEREKRENQKIKELINSETFDFGMENVVKQIVTNFKENDTFWYIKLSDKDKKQIKKSNK
jgi:hypothetical protein